MKSNKRKDILSKKRTAKANRMSHPGSKSDYQLKIGRKNGKGRIDPNWQWWSEREAA